AAQPPAGGVIGDEEADGPLPAGLHDQLALELERIAHERGDQHRLAEKGGDTVGVDVRAEDGVDRGAEPRDAPADGLTLDLKRRNDVVTIRQRIDGLVALGLGAGAARSAGEGAEAAVLA